jgi:hypothetical protein
MMSTVSAAVLAAALSAPVGSFARVEQSVIRARVRAASVAV